LVHGLLVSMRTMKTSWLFLFALFIPLLISCAQVEVSFDADNVARSRYIYDPSEVPATPLCTLTNLESYAQETGVWCWAASAQAVINYLGHPNKVEQCDIVNKTVGDLGGPYTCCKAVDSYIPSSTEQADPAFNYMLARCRVRWKVSNALQQNGYRAEDQGPLKWPKLHDQLCGENKPYIFVVQFYDDDGNFAGRHSSVVEGARVTSSGDRYVEVSDHADDDFFLMKWEAFQHGVPGDFKHEIDYINIKHQ